MWKMTYPTNIQEKRFYKSNEEKSSILTEKSYGSKILHNFIEIECRKLGGDLLKWPPNTNHLYL